MKYVLYIILIISLSACSFFEPKTIILEVYTPPKVEMPQRPVLVSDSGGDTNDITKNAEKDLLDLSSYATQLENVILKLLKRDN